MPLTEKQLQELNEIGNRVTETETAILDMANQTGGQTALSKLSTGGKKPDYSAFTDEELRAIFDGAVRAPALNNLSDGFDPATQKQIGPPHPHSPLAVSDRGVETKDLSREEMIESIDALLEHNGYNMDPQRIATAQSMMVNAQAAELEGRVDRCTQALMKLGEGVEGFDDDPQVKLLKQRIAEADNKATVFSRFSEEKCHEYVHQGLQAKFRQLATQEGPNGIEVAAAIETAKKGLDPTNMSGGTKHLRKINPELLKLNLTMNLEGVDLSHSDLRDVILDGKLKEQAQLAQQKRLEEYTRAKLKDVLQNKSGVFSAINNDKTLTPLEKQQVCCAIGKYATQVECQEALAKNPATLLRENNGATTFIADYLRHHAKDYFKAVNERSMRSIEDPSKNELEVGRDIVRAYTTELPRLSKEAAEFIKVSVDVVKQEMPEHAEEVTPMVLSNNLLLRGGCASVAVTLKTTGKFKAALEVEEKVNKALEDVSKPVTNAQREVNTLNGAVKSKRQEIESTPGRIEQRVLEQQLKDLEKKLKVAEKELETAQRTHGANIEKVREEGQKELEPYQATLATLRKGMTANSGVQALANQITGEVERNVVGRQLQTDKPLVGQLQTSLEQVADGTVEGREVTTEVPTPTVDLEGLQVEVEVEAQQQKEKMAETLKRQNEAARLQSQRAPQLVAEKAGPEKEKLDLLVKKLDSIRDKTYQPTTGEKFQAFFSRGGMNTVLAKLKEKTIEEIDKVKMQIHQKADLDDFNKVQKQSQGTAETLGEELAKTQRAAEYYTAALQELHEIDHALEQSEVLESSLMISGQSKKGVADLLKRKEEAEQTLETYREGFRTHLINNASLTSVKKDVSVREQLNVEKAALEKEQQLSQKQGQQPKQPQAKTLKVG